MLRDLYNLIRDFKGIMFSKKYEKLTGWINDAKRLNVVEPNTFLDGLWRDLVAIKNGIANKYSNGLAEEIVNKIKVIMRIMYGRNSFELLRAKALLR